MKFYLLVVHEEGYVDTFGPYDSGAERDRKARLLRKRLAEEDDSENLTFVKVTGEVVGPLEAGGYTDMDLL